MGFESEVVNRYGSIVEENMTSMLTIISEGNANSDENIVRLHELSEAIMREYRKHLSSSLAELKRAEPQVLQQISVNDSMKTQRQKYQQAIAERETKRIELIRKVKSLRKQVPEILRLGLSTHV